MAQSSTLKSSLRTVLATGLLMAGLIHGASAQTDKNVMKLGHTLAPDNHYQLTALEFAKASSRRPTARSKSRSSRSRSSAAKSR